MKAKKILITNDDGIKSPAIWALRDGLSKIAHCEVVAPQKVMSGVGHGVSLTRNIRLHPVRKNGTVTGYGVDGTPADTVKLALSELFSREHFDLAVSGINLGPNTGVSVYYSGTVAAAREAFMSGIPAFAVSISSFRCGDLTYAVDLAVEIAAAYLERRYPQDLFLNVNVPCVKRGKVRGVRVTRQAPSQFLEFFEKKTKNGRHHYYLKGDLVLLKNGRDLDQKVLDEGYVSITPLRLDLTHYPYLGITRKLAKRLSRKRSLNPG
ncbi:MAG TPA: 5'/3'-nucleotidase SurE [Candidatus Omnitrophota bacterium]|nr:5'/3'-nucleotidase SurE [Candidatus Omnitrophota bacterium]